MTAAEVKVAAQRWYERQLQQAEAAHGARWPANREWIEDYLRTELRMRLAARGWRTAP